MPTVKAGKRKETSSTGLEDFKELVESKLEYIESALEDIIKRLEKIEKTLQEVVNKIETSRTRTWSRTGGYGSTLLDMVRDQVYLETNKIRAKKTLKRLIDEGKLILLRDDMLNLEVVTTPENVRKIISKLPLPVEEADKVLSEREYELLKILNRLGYVLIRDNVYVKTELADELIGKS